MILKIIFNRVENHRKITKKSMWAYTSVINNNIGYSNQLNIIASHELLRQIKRKR